MASDSFLTSRQPNPNYQRWIQSTILENEIAHSLKHFGEKKHVGFVFWGLRSG